MRMAYQGEGKGRRTRQVPGWRQLVEIPPSMEVKTDYGTITWHDVQGGCAHLFTGVDHTVTRIAEDDFRKAVGSKATCERLAKKMFSRIESNATRRARRGRLKKELPVGSEDELDKANQKGVPSFAQRSQPPMESQIEQLTHGPMAEAGCTERQSEALVKVAIEGMSRAAAGREMGITRQTARVHFNKGKEKVSRYYGLGKVESKRDRPGITRMAKEFIAQLTDIELEAWCLMAIGGLSMEEVAEATGKTEGRVAHTVERIEAKQAPYAETLREGWR